MAEETRQSKLAAAKKKLKEYWQRNSPGVPAAAKRNRKANGSSPETATSGGCHSSEASPRQEQAAVLDSRSVKISRLNNTIKSLKQQKKQVEHQLEEEKEANSEKQKAQRELEVQIQRLNIENKKLNTDLYRTKRSLRYFEEESRDLAGRLQRSSQRTGELERALCAVAATQKKPDGFSSRSKALMKMQLEQSIREQILLKRHVTQLKESLKEVQLERDQYALQIKGERAQWQQRMRKMSQEVCTLKEAKKHDTHRVEELERSLSKLKNQTAEPLLPDPPAVPSEVELQDLRKELERVAGELQAQVENNRRINLLNRGQKERLREQEERLQEQQERLQEQEKRLQQLAEPQSDYKELKNEDKSALQWEQQVKELQEKLGQVTETVTSAQKEPEAAAPASGAGGESVSGETLRALREVMEKLESGLMDLLEEKADLREHVEKLEVRFIQYWRERCHQKVHRLLTEPGGSAKDAAPGGGHHQAGPGQGGGEGEAAGAAGDGVAACANYNEGHGKFLAAARNPAAEPGPGAPAPQELGAADMHGDPRLPLSKDLCEVSLTNSVEPAQGEAREGSSQDNPTAQPIVQLLGEMQDHQEHPGLGRNPCVPCFCWAWLPRGRR
ncbi:golgin subfamily A member 8B-like isoform X3 [Pongo abelii]|uniref:golgin subfamily A member 8B-like isoform X3 n=1 Tax=Pongo abelii TaxID=9601 RepID=UPI0023E8C9CD|nr:golgin subfamily A member 8B-like isoform X3 [Pongo abelii]XP_054388274.1 golgin subfamily A member 8B-like isoform X3 [Pongo abelii]XP_054401895.1 golgin subfamily A member 8B-like isoform X3 [Pongo abelii]